MIIISDYFCQQWLGRTHKVTNPIKLVIQVLNYTRKHRYPERRSAFTYIDEEQPTRMDYGKEKFGGPFTEEEVEDVKTVLRMIPLVICLSLTIGACSIFAIRLLNFEGNLDFFSFVDSFLPISGTAVFSQKLIYVFNMLSCIRIALFITLTGYIFSKAVEVYELVTQDVHSCGTSNITTWQGSKLDLYFYGSSIYLVSEVLLLLFYSLSL